MKLFARVVILLLVAAADAYAQGDGGYSGRGVVIGGILTEGNKVTRRDVILRELDMHEGEFISRDSIAQYTTQNRLRLFNLQLFNEVEQWVSEKGKDTIIWHIKVKERWYIIPKGIVQFADRNLNTWWADQNHDLNRVSAGLTITDRNFRGNLEQLSVTVQAGYTQQFGVSYIRPYINSDRTHGIGVIASVAQSKQTYYTTALNKLAFVGGYRGPVIWRQMEGGLEYLYRPGYANRHIVTASYNEYIAGDSVLILNGDYFADSSTRARFIELNYRYEHNGVDNWNYSLEGEKMVSTLVTRFGMEGIRFQSYVNVEAGVFRQPIPKWYVSAILRGRLMAPQPQPYYFRNGLGTATDYVRGYEYYVTDGYSYGLMRFSLKRQIFNNTYSLPIQYFTAIPVRVYPKVFFDVGYIDGPTGHINSLSNTLMYSVGAGIDVVTLYDVKIRLEYARNQLGQNGVYLHFNSE